MKRVGTFYSMILASAFQYSDRNVGSLLKRLPTHKVVCIVR